MEKDRTDDRVRWHRDFHLAAAPVEALIGLTKLSVAPENVCRTDRRGGVEGLAENIARGGLL